MIVTFLGTGTSQGVPVIACDCNVCRSIDFKDKRLRSSVHIDIDGLSLIVDTGPDFRQQVLRERIYKLDAILYTHEHKDHTAGMDDIRAFNFKQKKDIPIYARHKVLQQLRKEFEYVFAADKYPGVPQVLEKEIFNKPFCINGIYILPVEVLHYKLPVFGFRIKDFTYITDANHISDIEAEKLRGTRILVLNALQVKTHLSHFNLEQAIGFAESIEPEKTYFTHISHRMGLHKKISQTLPENIALAYDGLKLNL